VSYTPPAWNAADHTFPGGTYTPADAAAADFSWGGQSTGFTSTLFGTPLAGYLVVQTATGAAPSTVFGLANVLPGYVPSLGVITLFGTPVGPQYFRASAIKPTTRFSPAYYSFSQTFVASGFTRTRMGYPSRIKFKQRATS